MNRSVLNRTLLNTSVLCQSRLNQSGLASLCGKSGGIPSAIRRAMVLWYDIARQGCTNENMAENPVLKDLSGNGHDATCYNFGWSIMSGVGGYNFQNLDTWIPNTGIEVNVINHNKVSLTNSRDMIGIRAGFLKDTTFKLRVSDIDSTIPVYIYRKRGGGNEDELLQTITENGDYAVELVHNPDDVYNIIVLTGRAIFEQLPNYPGALVSDGVDDYCLAEELPLLTREKGYTVVARRKWFTNEKATAFVAKNTNSYGNDGGFQFEYVNGKGNNFRTSSFASNISILDLYTSEEAIVYQTSKNYNGQKDLIPKAVSDTGGMALFRFSVDESYLFGQFALYTLLLFNRDLTEDEINWVKTNLITV